MSHIEPDLLAYLDGELSPTELASVEAHVAGCPACAAELVELQRLRAGLSTVVPVVYDSVHLPSQAEARIRRALATARGRQERSGLPQAGPAGLWAGLLAALRPLSKAAIPLVAVFFFGMVLSAANLPAQSGAQQTVVLGQDTLAPGSQAALRVVVNNVADSQPIANASVDVQMRQAGLARTVFSGVTDATGSAPVQFQVPADWEGSADLVVATESELGQDEVVAPVQLQRSYRLLLSSDKPVYQPGETIHLRTLALGTVDESPASGAVARFEVFDSSGRQLLSQQQLSSEFGIAATSLPLAADAPLGPYQIRVTLGDTVSELSVTLGQAPLPNYLVDVRADAPYYLPGDLIRGEVSATYFFGKPVAAGDVLLRMVGLRLGQDPAVGEELLFVEGLRGETDGDGVFPFQFQLPELPADAFGVDGVIDLALEASVVDSTGDAQFGWQSLALAREPILIDVTPEDGVLHAGIENILYVLTSYPDGRPAPTALQVQIGSGAVIEEDTNDLGLAQVRYTPRAGAEGDREVRVAAADLAGRTGAAAVILPLDEAQETLLLRTDQALYQVGDTMAVEAIATGSGPAVFVDVIKGGQTLLTQSALVEDGKATLGIDLTPALVGALELNAYQITGDSNILRDTRVALVEAPEDIQVRLATDQAEYRPGEEAQLSVETTAEGEGVQTAVGLAVVNEAVYGQREYQPGFARAYFLLDQALQASGVSQIDTAEAAAQAQIELRAAQQLTAKASWAGYSGRDYSLSAQSVDQTGRAAVNSTRQQAFSGISLAISLALMLASLLVAAIVVVGLRRSGALGQALGRLLLTLILLAVVGAGLIVLTQQLTGRLADQGLWLLLAAVGGIWLALLIGLLVYGWRRGDQRIQYVALLLLAYVALLALLIFAAGQGATLASPWLLALALGFGVLLAALLLFGWGLRIEGQKRAGLTMLVLALLVMPLVAAFDAADFDGAEIIQRVAGPSVYGLGNGLLTGCAAPFDAPLAQEAAPERVAGPEAAPQAAPAPLPAADPIPESMAMQAEAEDAEAAAFTEVASEVDEVEMAGAPQEEVAKFAAEPEATEESEVEMPAVETSLAAEEGDTSVLTSTLALEMTSAITSPVAVETPEVLAAAPVTGTMALQETPTITPTLAITATTTPTATITGTPTVTATITDTPTATVMITDTPTVTATFTAAETGMRLSEATPRATPARTLLPSFPPSLLGPLTPTPTPAEAEAAVQAQAVGAGDTPTPTQTPNWTPEPTPTSMTTPVSTPTVEPTLTPQATDTPLPAATPTPQPPPAEPTPVAPPPTATPQPSPTATPQPPPTATPQPSPTATPTGASPSVEAPAPLAAVRMAEPAEVPLESLPIIRERFPQTLYWNPEVITDSAGRAAVRIPTGDSITTWRVTALAVDRNGRLGSAVAPMVVFQPLFVTTNLPARMTIGEQFDARMQIFNYSQQDQPVRLAVQASPGLRVEFSQQSLIVPANDVVAVSARVQAVSSGLQTITLAAVGDGVQDVRQTTILVQ